MHDTPSPRAPVGAKNIISREGKLDVLKELCQENKINYFVVKALKAQDKFGQTPMLSAINAPENRWKI